MDNKRNVVITLEKAKEWYNQGGELKEVALQAFNEGELKDVVVRPRSWEEYCENPTKEGYYIGSWSSINECGTIHRLSKSGDRNILPTRELAEEFLVYMQLVSLRHAWIHQWSVDNGLTEDWEPDWSSSDEYKYCVISYNNTICIDQYNYTNHALSFPTREMAEEFLNCFKDLLEVAKPLI